MLDVCLPGTGGVVPRLDRFLSCCYLRYEGVGLLIDCGEGTQLSVKKAGFSLGKISILLLTHYHADHVSGLPGLLLSMGNEGKTSPLYIFGPKGLDAIIKGLLVIVPELPFKIITKTLADFDTFTQHNYTVTAFELRHSCPCLGYDIRISRGGKFDKEKAIANEVPLKYWSILQRGETIDGYTPDMVLGKTRRGLHVTYSTDTRPCEIISTMAYDADLLVCEGMFELEKSARAKESAHMTMASAAKLAKDAECAELWLTHYSPSLPNPEEFENEPKAIFPNTVISSDGITKTLRFADE
ncbi:MAG: ribonuclease Z [Eubacteriales bacterium]|nr:ribonuclease Z [Clostridia bacterium]MDY2845187.1 ribonuclease Z [Eubacteriales bacterium]